MAQWWKSPVAGKYGFHLWSGRIPHSGATKPVCNNCWDYALEPGNLDYWAHVPQLLKPSCPRAHALQQEKPPQWEACTPQRRVVTLATTREKPVEQWRPSIAQNKQIKMKTQKQKTHKQTKIRVTITSPWLINLSGNIYIYNILCGCVMGLG